MGGETGGREGGHGRKGGREGSEGRNGRQERRGDGRGRKGRGGEGREYLGAVLAAESRLKSRQQPLPWMEKSHDKPPNEEGE